MMDWLDHWFPGVKAPIPVANSSSSNSSKRHRGKDGPATVSWVPAAQNVQTHTTRTLHPTLYTVYKFELASPGDPQLQLARYQLVSTVLLFSACMICLGYSYGTWGNAVMLLHLSTEQARRASCL